MNTKTYFIRTFNVGIKAKLIDIIERSHYPVRDEDHDQWITENTDYLEAEIMAELDTFLGASLVRLDKAESELHQRVRSMMQHQASLDTGRLDFCTQYEAESLTSHLADIFSADFA